MKNWNLIIAVIFAFFSLFAAITSKKSGVGTDGYEIQIANLQRLLESQNPTVAEEINKLKRMSSEVNSKKVGFTGLAVATALISICYFIVCGVGIRVRK